jgi:hypothetical protein
VSNIDHRITLKRTLRHRGLDVHPDTPTETLEAIVRSGAAICRGLDPDDPALHDFKPGVLLYHGHRCSRCSVREGA